MNKILSVVVPAYNAEKTISRTLNSVLTNESVREIIVVNDGSCDGTEQVCKETAQKDKRVKIYSKQNAGPNSARKMGINKAQSEWATFIDADDYLSPHAYDDIFKTPQIEQFDIVEFGYKSVDAAEQTIAEHKLKNKIYTGRECAANYAKQHNSIRFLHNKIYKRRLFDGVEFTNFFHGEDQAVASQLHIKALKKLVLPEIYLNYFIREGSLCNLKFSLRSLDVLKSYYFIDELYKNNAPNLCVYSAHDICAHSIINWYRCYSSPLQEVQKEKTCKMLRALFRKTSKRMGVMRLFARGTIKFKAAAALFIISPPLMASLWPKHSAIGRV